MFLTINLKGGRRYKLSSPNKNQKTIFIWPEGILPGIYQEELSGYSSIFDKNFSENFSDLVKVLNDVNYLDDEKGT